MMRALIKAQHLHCRKDRRNNLLLTAHDLRQEYFLIKDVGSKSLGYDIIHVAGKIRFVDSSIMLVIIRKDAT